MTGGAASGAILLGHASGWAAALCGIVVGAAVALGMRLRSGPVRQWGTRGMQLGFTPWGVLVEPEDGPRLPEEGARVLHWAAIERVHLEMIYGRDGGTPSTLFSNVTVETGREAFVARAAGAVPLDTVLVHMDAYAREQAQKVALDLDGARAGEGPVEPDFEPLLSAALESIESAPSSHRLGLPPSGYRRASARAASAVTVDVLREVLCDRTAKAVDPRAFAAVLAVELHAVELAQDLARLAQSPHPLLAAVARAGACKLGASVSKVGSIEEVAPFLLPDDVVAIEAWTRVSSHSDESVRLTVA